MGLTLFLSKHFLLFNPDQRSAVYADLQCSVCVVISMSKIVILIHICQGREDYIDNHLLTPFSFVQVYHMFPAVDNRLPFFVYRMKHNR